MNRFNSKPHGRMTRRALTTGLAATFGAFSLAACSRDSDGEATPEPTPTTAVEPTPTQAAIASPVPGYVDPTRWTGRTLAIAGWGGDYENAQDEAFFAPFQEMTGAQIQVKKADIDRMKDQVNEQSVTWDLITVPMDMVLSLGRENYLSPIDYKIVDDTALIPEFALQFGVGVACYSTVMVYSPELVTVPKSWAEFWDVQAPGEGEELLPAATRILPHSPVGTLEFALLADGVPANELYPLDIERAFSALERIRKNVVIWYEDGKQPIEVVLAGQAGMGAAWNVRAVQFGDPAKLDYTWDGGMLSGDAWVIPAGAPNADVALDFINFATRAVPSANFSRLVPYGPINLDSLTLLRDDRMPILPNSPANKKVQFVQNWNWWADNVEDLGTRFDEWILNESDEATPRS
ncbi:MAG: extracellular solute-binding protein [Thermomicrobiales bacterium]